MLLSSEHDYYVIRHDKKLSTILRIIDESQSVEYLSIRGGVDNALVRNLFTLYDEYITVAKALEEVHHVALCKSETVVIIDLKGVRRFESNEVRKLNKVVDEIGWNRNKLVLLCYDKFVPAGNFKELIDIDVNVKEMLEKLWANRLWRLKQEFIENEMCTLANLIRCTKVDR